MSIVLVYYFCSVLRLLVTVSIVPSSQILVTLMMEALCSADMSVLTRATRSNIPETCILHCLLLVYYITVIWLCTET
jgi:hypothetical protein